MTITRVLASFTLATAVVTAGAVLTHAQSPADGVTIPLSDPARPATVSVDMITGSITVRGSDRKDVLLTSRSRDNGNGSRDRGRGRTTSDSQGLRQLTQVGGFEATENNNRISIESSSPNRSVDIEVQVPRRTNLKLQTINNGFITIEGVEGEIEAENTNGPVTLTNVAGSVVANTLNGALKATVTRLTADKAMAFTSFNGNVDVTLPPTTKANLKMRSDNGDIYTDFDVQMRPLPAPTTTARRGGGVQIEVNSAIYGSINGGGPEFELRTFNGNIYVRKASQ
jgi:hypothetical protein